MRSRRPWTLCRAFWMLLAVVLLVPALASAQTETGRISGTATDEQGGVLPGATVTITNTGTGVTRTGVTDESGRYVFTNLQPGRYEVSAELTGFAKNSGTVIVPVGAAMEFNPKLGLAGTSETVQVVSETPAINVLNAEQSTTVSETQIRELPTITRNAYDLVAALGQASPRPGVGPRHRLLDQRRALGQHQRPARRLGQQRRVHGHASARTCRSTRCRSSRSSPRTSRPSTAAPRAAS